MHSLDALHFPSSISRQLWHYCRTVSPTFDSNIFLGVSTVKIYSPNNIEIFDRIPIIDSSKCFDKMRINIHHNECSICAKRNTFMSMHLIEIMLLGWYKFSILCKTISINKSAENVFLQPIALNQNKSRPIKKTKLSKNIIFALIFIFLIVKNSVIICFLRIIYAHK